MPKLQSPYSETYLASPISTVELFAKKVNSYKQLTMFPYKNSIADVRLGSTYDSDNYFIPDSILTVRSIVKNLFTSFPTNRPCYFCYFYYKYFRYKNTLYLRKVPLLRLTQCSRFSVFSFHKNFVKIYVIKSCKPYIFSKTWFNFL